MRVELPDHPPPPATLYPFPASFCRLGPPFFSRREAGVDEHFVPVEQALLIKHVDEGLPDLHQHRFAFPLGQVPPTGARRGILLGQVTLASAAAKYPQNAFQARSIIGRRTASSGRSLARREWLDPFPLLVRDEDFMSPGH